MKTLLRIGAQLSLRRAYPPRSHDNSLFTLQTTYARRVAPDRDTLDLLQTPVVPGWCPPDWCPPGGARMVEVNGFEPMTSCLQSRRSPS